VVAGGSSAESSGESGCGSWWLEFKKLRRSWMWWLVARAQKAQEDLTVVAGGSSAESSGGPDCGDWWLERRKLTRT